MRIQSIGAFGKVYKGQHKITNEIRAIKAISRANVDEEQEQKLFEEIAILKELVYFYMFL